MSVLPKYLVLESAEDCGRGLFVEVQLRHWLVAGDLDFRLLIVRRDNPRVGKEFRVGIFVKSRSVTDICGTLRMAN